MSCCFAFYVDDDGEDLFDDNLTRDYKPEFWYWEVYDLSRKLLLSVIGSFWSTKTTVCVAVATLISTVSLVLHALYQPHTQQHALCNRAQTVMLSVLSCFYFIGTLLKTEELEPRDAHALAAIMLLLLAGIMYGNATLLMRFFAARSPASRR